MVDDAYKLPFATEEREQPELLAESPDRRKRVAQDSGKTEEQVNTNACFVFYPQHY